MPKITISKLKLGYDIVIVGAGIAGCVLAKNLSENLHVLLVDSKLLPRHKACSGIVVTQGRVILEALNPPKSIFLKPKEIHIVYADWAHGTEKEVKKGFLNTERERLDKWLYESVLEKENVDVLDKTRFAEAKYSEDRKHLALVLESNGDIKNIVTNYLVGCDGAVSLVRQMVSKNKPRRYVAIQELIKGRGIENAYFIFDDEITDWYCWVIPKGDLIDVGAALDPFKSREKFEKFKEKVKKRFGISGRGVFDSAMITRPESKKDIVLGENKVILSGESTGLISPSSGEGISFAFLSAKYLANAFNKNFKNPLPDYRKECTQLIDRVVQKIPKSKIISDKKKREKMLK